MAEPTLQGKYWAHLKKYLAHLKNIEHTWKNIECTWKDIFWQFWCLWWFGCVRAFKIADLSINICKIFNRCLKYLILSLHDWHWWSRWFNHVKYSTEICYIKYMILWLKWVNSPCHQGGHVSCNHSACWGKRHAQPGKQIFQPKIREFK